ncbi:hypothetical protein [Mesorhizobium sp. B2-8-3]|uniref:hypothetical protein n=1 Tax=Mesorhizobium sp. B2-8-3 TaxID=2589905 RepID=UPI00112C4A32|nr:hypothetical protein [Mesorhizobium sp. B2-8-3]TPJ32847.1 hypothetical protein FJ418_17105 [Mesorhizobium sp. B2-8-3]
MLRNWKAWPVAIGLVLAIGGLSWSQETQPSQQGGSPQPATAEDQQRTPQNSQTHTVAPAPSQVISEAKTTDDEQGNAGKEWRENLVEHAPDWSVAFFTFVLCVFTGLLWRSTNKLWLAGEKQMKLIQDNAAQQSTDMQASTKAAQDAVAVSRETGVTQVRAYISVTKVEVSFHPLPYLIDVVTGKSTKQYQMWVDLKVGNFGRTPARRIQTSWVISRYADPSDVWAGRRNFIENIDIPPEQTDYIVSDAQFKAPAEAGERFANQEIDLVLEGAVIYDPVVGPPQRITPFLYLLSFDETLDSGVKIRMSTYVDHAT